MNIADKHVVSVSYHLTVPDENGSAEQTVEKTSPEEPFTFLFGSGGLLPEFEKNLSGKIAGDSFDFRITAENGYGVYQIENIVNIPIQAFLDESGKLDTEMVVVGNSLPMMDNEGHRLMGVVKEVALNHVRMDFNHPLAGKELHFTGEVLLVRPATAEELDHGHVHGPGGHHH
ncbi:MAG: FKBP-type peptidyl-prolyl cis-trans isomerase SlyD [Bacteroidetes bacterium]|nr:MAG: FKBP-type peptidyl-prolyl cis-trans isomerase SlyD [Bacteroidota bacterium]